MPVKRSIAAKRPAAIEARATVFFKQTFFAVAVTATVLVSVLTEFFLAEEMTVFGMVVSALTVPPVKIEITF